MNERMNELINQCFIGTTDGKLSELNTVANVEKFAELIIQECLDFCRHEPNDDPYDGYDIGYDSATQNIRKSIQTHFRVEE